MLEGISSLVAVVPVIAKADTHTEAELMAYKQEVLQVRPQGNQTNRLLGGVTSEMPIIISTTT